METWFPWTLHLVVYLHHPHPDVKENGPHIDNPLCQTLHFTRSSADSCVLLSGENHSRHRSEAETANPCGFASSAVLWDSLWVKATERCAFSYYDGVVVWWGGFDHTENLNLKALSPGCDFNFSQVLDSLLTHPHHSPSTLWSCEPCCWEGEFLVRGQTAFVHQGAHANSNNVELWR